MGRICAAALLLLAPLHAFRPAAAPRLAPLRTARFAAADAPTLNQQINELGLSLKAKGVQQRDKFVAAGAIPAKAKHLVGAGLLFGVFVCYRVYRGFFVLLPAVFGEVRDKVRTEMLKKYGADADLDPKTGALRRKTAALVNAAFSGDDLGGGGSARVGSSPGDYGDYYSWHAAHSRRAVDLGEDRVLHVHYGAGKG